ncbi:MAG: hypothetical protein ACREGB_01830 [Candidatus Saccharimonadales bacterium]
MISTEDLMIKIRKLEYPLQGGGHYFHRFLEPYTVQEPFYLTPEQWHDYHEFEAFKCNVTTKPPTGMDFDSEAFVNWMNQEPSIQEMQRLLKKSGTQIWQFNAVVDKPTVFTTKDVSEETYYIRRFAVFSNITMRPVNRFEDALMYPYLRRKARFLNFFVGLYNKGVNCLAMTASQAAVVLARGGIVSTLDYGARQCLFKEYQQVLHIRLPFYPDGTWKPYDQNRLPEFLGKFVEVQS